MYPATLPPRVWVAFYLSILTLYLLTASGRLEGSDELAMFNVTRSLVTEGSLSSDPCTPTPRSNHCVPGINGKNYAGFGLVPSLIETPAYAAAIPVAAHLHRDTLVVAGLFASLFHVFFAAAVPLVLALWLCRIGMSVRAAFLVAIVYAVSSPAWYYSKTFCSEIYFALGLLACCYFLAGNDRNLSLLAAGAGYGLTVGSRVYGLILAPVIVIYGLMLWRSRERRPMQIARNLTMLGIPVAISVGLIALSNQVRFGSVLKTGYHLLFPTIAELLSTPLLQGLKSLFFDTEVGLLIYVPWVIVVPFLWKRLWTSHPCEAVLVVAMTLVNVVFFAKYNAWHGGWALEPRMLYAIIPFLAIPLAAIFDPGPQQLPKILKASALGLIGASLLIQIILVPYPMSRYYEMQFYNQQHGVHAWWDGKPLLEAVTAEPELFFAASSPDDSPAHQSLLTFANSVNLVRADFWLVKIVLLGIPRIVSFTIFLILLIGLILSCHRTSSALRAWEAENSIDRSSSPAPAVVSSGPIS
jgi:hypothetical protein